MAIRGYTKPLYVLPFDHRGSFETGMFGWKGALDAEQTAQIAAAKQVIYDGFSRRLRMVHPGKKAPSWSTSNSAQPSFTMLRRRASPSHVQPRRAGRMSLTLNMAKTLRLISRPSSYVLQGAGAV